MMSPHAKYAPANMISCLKLNGFQNFTETKTGTFGLISLTLHIFAHVLEQSNVHLRQENCVNLLSEKNLNYCNNSGRKY